MMKPPQGILRMRKIIMNKIKKGSFCGYLTAALK